MIQTVNTHHLVVDFGKYRGKPWTQIPLSYLRWILNEPDFKGKETRNIAESEIVRRGSILDHDGVFLTPHAIDRASQRCLHVWQETKLKDEGLYSWLLRMSKEAIARNNVEGKVKELKNFKLKTDKLLFVFETGEIEMVLKSVRPA